MTEHITVPPLPREQRLTRYPDYLDDPEGLDSFRRHLKDTRDWHDMAPVNCNSLARLVETIDRLIAAAPSVAPAPVEGDVQEALNALRQEVASFGGSADHETRAGDWTGIGQFLTLGHLRAIEAGIAGRSMVMVPREPTRRMLRAAYSAALDKPFPDNMPGVYRAMIAAAQQDQRQ